MSSVLLLQGIQVAFQKSMYKKTFKFNILDQETTN